MPPPARAARRELAFSHPVAATVAVNRMRNHMRTVGIEVFLMQEGENARGLLSHLGWMIGLGAEIAATVAPRSPQARTLHGALRTLLQTVVDGATWRIDQAEPLWQAAQQSHQLLVDNPHIGLAAEAGADYIAQRIKDGTASMADVAGAELYSPSMTTERQA